MRVTYVLPKLVDHPIGGYKVHYQYADGLARRGHEVTLVHPITAGARPSARDHLRLAAARRRGRSGRVPISWFEFDPTVRSVLLAVLDSGRLPAADVTILTAWQTAERTIGAPARAGALVQVVYDYEFWVTQPEVRPAMRRALGRSEVRHVATSQSVGSMLREIGVEPIATITAGLAEGEFGVDVAPSERHNVVGFARRFQPSKDPATALAALELIRDEEPETSFVSFGDAEGVAMPSWVQSLGRVTQPQLRAFYNRCGVFLLTSKVEGWGLPALEAMACGAAVVSTESGGVSDFLQDGVNGALVPVGDPAGLAARTLELLRQPDQRIAMATRGAQDAKPRTVGRSVDELERLVLGIA